MNSTLTNVQDLLKKPGFRIFVNCWVWVRAHKKWAPYIIVFEVYLHIHAVMELDHHLTELWGYIVTIKTFFQKLATMIIA